MSIKQSDKVEQKLDIDHVEESFKTNAQGEDGDYAPDSVQRTVEILQDAATAAAAKKYMRKLDWIILPAITFLYFLEYLDRGNVAVGHLHRDIRNITDSLNRMLVSMASRLDTTPREAVSVRTKCLCRPVNGNLLS